MNFEETAQNIIDLTLKAGASDCDVVLAKSTKNDSETKLHSGFEGGFQDPNQQFVVANNDLFASFVNVSVSLVDIPDNSGFTCLPGSHKGNFKIPKNIKLHDGSPTVVNCLLYTSDAADE